MQVFGMPVFLFKSLLAVLVVACALTAMFTMFEVFGRAERRYDAEKLKRAHRVNGVIYVLLFFLVAYFCLDYLVSTRADLSPRSAFHSVFALSVIVLLALKVAYVRFYRGFYEHAKTLGVLVALLTFGMAGTSAGYFLLVSAFGKDIPGRLREEAAAEGDERKIAAPRTDRASVGAGRKLYESNCSMCHYPHRSETLVGPGHKGILKNPRLPISGRPATPENVKRQLKTPYRNMPPFDHLEKEQVENIIAYLNTL